MKTDRNGCLTETAKICDQRPGYKRPQEGNEARHDGMFVLSPQSALHDRF